MRRRSLERTPASARALKGIILSGGPAQRLRAGRAAARPALLRARRAGARHLLRDAARGARARRPGRARRRGREYGRARAGQRRRRCSPACAAAKHGLDEPRRPASSACPPGFRVLAAHRQLPLRGGRGTGRPLSSACSSTPRSRTRRAAQRSSRTSCYERLRLRRQLDDGQLRRRGRSPRSRAQVGARRVICGLSRRRGLARSLAAAAAPRDRRAARLHLRGQRPAARRTRRRRSSTTFGDRFAHPRCTSIDASEQFLAALAGVTDPEEKRRRIGNEFIDVFEREAAQRCGERAASWRRARSTPT